MTFADPELYANGIPHDLLTRLRNDSPVSWQLSSRNPNDGFWLVTRHADVVRVSKNPGLFSSKEGNLLVEPPSNEMRHGMLGMLFSHLATVDPPLHAAQRSVVSPPFAKQVVAGLEPRIRAEVVDVLEKAIAQGKCDLARDVALELPLRIILGDMLGVAPDDRDQLVRWSNMLVAPLDPNIVVSPADALTAAGELYEFGLTQLHDRRERPREDLISVLAHSRTANGGHITEELFSSYWFPLVLGAFDTTASTIAGAALALADHPEQWLLLREDAGVIPTAVDEMLRWVSPVNYMRRTATQDFRLHDQNIRRGQRVVMSYPSANFDDRVFSKPHLLDLTRSPNPHVTFGHGAHYCLGSHVASLLIRTTLEELRVRVGTIERHGRVERLRSNWMARVVSMPVTLHSAIGSGGTSRTRRAIVHGDEPRSEGASTTLWQALLAAADTKPERSVVCVGKDGSRVQTSYCDLVRRANAVGEGLRVHGIKPGDKVVLLLADSQALLEAFWGCVAAGAVPALLGGTELLTEGTWRQLDAPLVVTDEEETQQVCAATAARGITAARVVAWQDLPAEEPAGEARPQRAPEAVAIVLFSSGSTGTPKSIPLSHQNILGMSLGISQMRTMSSDDVFVNWMPMDHIGGIGYGHITAVVQGANQVLIDKGFVMQDPLRWFDVIHEFRGTVTWAPNVVYGLVNAHWEQIARREWDLSSLRHLGNAGEAIVARTARRALSLLMSKGMPEHAMHPMWGMSETASAAISSDRFSLQTAQDDDLHIELGKPIPGLSLRVVDTQGTVVPEGVTGQLQVRGRSVFPGYLVNGKIDQTAFSADGWFETGDLAVVRNGRVTMTGRSKDVIVINGIGVTAEEIEDVVAQAHVVPEDAIICACAARLPGWDSEVPAIFVGLPPEQQDSLSLSAAVKTIRRVIVRRFAVLPAAVLTIAPEVFPRSSIGKIQRSKLADRLARGEFDELIAALEQDTPHQEEDTQPRDEIEGRVAEICHDLLGISKVGVETNLLEVGVTSLLMVTLRQALERDFDTVPPLAELYQLGTIASIATTLR